MLKRSEPIFAVSDVRRTVAFYKEVLGFGDEWFWGDPPTFAGIGMGSVRVMFHHQPHIAAHIEGHEHSFGCDAVDELFARHQAAGATIVSPIENRPWGLREYTLRDPDGYHLRFGGPPTYEKPATALETMPGHIRIETRKPSAEEYRTLYAGVGWNEPKDPGAIDRALAGVIAIDTRSDRPVGMARIMHDGWAWYSVWDVIVLPDYQALRIGTALVEAALAHLRATAPAGSIVYLFTYKHAFYERLGFTSESCTLIRI